MQSILRNFIYGILKSHVSSNHMSNQDVGTHFESLYQKVITLFVSAMHPDKENVVDNQYLLPFVKRINKELRLEENDECLMNEMNKFRHEFLKQTDKSVSRINIMDYLSENLSSLFDELCILFKIKILNFAQIKKTFLEEQYPSHERIIRGARRGNIAMVESALLDGADINALSTQREGVQYDDELRFDEFPLQIASGNGDYSMVQFLLKQGANPTMASHRGNFTALHAAKGNKAIVELLVEYGANINAVFLKHETPLYFALRILKDERGASSKKQLIDIALYYINRGANLDDSKVSYEDYENSLMEVAVRTGEIQILEAITQKGIDFVAWRGRKNTTLLHHAIYSHHPKLIVYLLDLGIDIHAIDTNGLTALDWCPNHEMNDPNMDSIKAIFLDRLKIIKDARLQFIQASQALVAYDHEHSTEIVPYQWVKNDYEFIWHVMQDKVTPIEEYAKERGAYFIKVRLDRERLNFFISNCSSEYRVAIGDKKYDVCGNFWFYLLEGYHPKKEDNMRGYGDPGFFYARTEDYYHIKNPNAGWPIKYEDGTVVSRSDFFAKAAVLFPETLQFYLVEENSDKSDCSSEKLNAQRHLQIREIYIHLLETEHPELSREQVELQFQHKILSLPKVLVKVKGHIKSNYTHHLFESSYDKCKKKLGDGVDRFQILEQIKLDYPHYNHLASVYSFVETKDKANGLVYVSNIMKKFNFYGRWFKQGEAEEAYLVMINAAREKNNQPLLKLEDIHAGMKVVLDLVTQEAQLLISDYEQLLKPYLETDIHFDEEKYNQFLKEKLPVRNPYKGQANNKNKSYIENHIDIYETKKPFILGMNFFSDPLGYSTLSSEISDITKKLKLV